MVGPRKDWEWTRNGLTALEDPAVQAAAAALTDRDWQHLPRLIVKLLEWHLINPDNYFISTADLLAMRGGRHYKRRLALLEAAGFAVCLERAFSLKQARKYRLDGIATLYELLGYSRYESVAMERQHQPLEGEAIRREGLEWLYANSNLGAVLAAAGKRAHYRSPRSHDYRHYNEVANLATTEREEIRLNSGERLVEIDACCSFGWSASINEFLDLSPEFRRTSQRGELYQAVAAQCPVRFERKELKHEVLTAFSHPNVHARRTKKRVTVWNAFENAFTATDFAQIRRYATTHVRDGFGRFIRRRNGKRVATMHTMLSSAEYQTFTIMLKALRERGIHAVTIHDCVLLPESRLDEALDVIRRIAPGSVKVKGLDVSYAPIQSQDTVVAHRFGLDAASGRATAPASATNSSPRDRETTVVCNPTGLLWLRGRVYQRRELEWTDPGPPERLASLA